MKQVSAADTWEEQSEAVEAYFYDGAPVPVPSVLDELTRNPAHRGGAWLLADISTSRLIN